MAADPLHYVVASLRDYGLSEAIATYHRMHEGGVADSLFRLFQQRESTSLTAQERDSMVSPAISGASCNKKGNMAFVSFQTLSCSVNPSENKRVRFAASPGGWAGLPWHLLARGEALFRNAMHTGLFTALPKALTRYNGTYVTLHSDVGETCVTTAPNTSYAAIECPGHSRGPPRRRAAATVCAAVAKFSTCPPRQLLSTGRAAADRRKHLASAGARTAL